ncbi:transglutaminase family protein [Marinitenerispora sediminis]|uniref:Transglutaminase n=1 Tax=Marinitenerispora sediminis TaxID=1931232 RepID=A0A368T5U4_9ACTN|nr:transglutaminase domain-containing protein [Marinitenerispora sediminis]RCV53245.1 transglutaminase [Marinitenerispora sediminis]RCV54944.1 transglutaminase [Marinitenerispora sediminis]RCV59067.1 transglutaminase [Marinitenerispora sediminis]
MVEVTARPVAAEPSGSRSRPGEWAAHVALAVLSAAAGVALAPGYVDPMLVGGLAAGWAVGGVLLTRALVGHLSSFATVVAGLPVALAGIVALAVWRPGPVPDPLGGAVDAVLRSGARILTGALPLPVAVDTLALPVLATWLSAVAATLAWRAARPLVAVLCGVLPLVGAVVLNAAAGPPAYPAVGLAAVAAVALLALSDGRGERANGAAAVATARIRFDTGGAPRGGAARGRLLAVAVAAVAVGLVAALGAPAALSSWRPAPLDPRAGVTAPVRTDQALNPLSYLSTWAADPDEPLLTVESDRRVELRWVALAEFTGSTWLPERGYQAAAGTLAEPDPPVPHASRVSADIAVDRLPGNWLPVVGAPRTVEGVDIGYDAASGTVVGIDAGASGQRYSVSGDVAGWVPEELAPAGVPGEGVFDRYRQLPGEVPGRISDIAAEAAGDGTPYQRAVNLARYLRHTYTFDPAVPSGHGYPRLERMLVPPGERGGGGTSEQFASAFAVLAREAGLPSRVVVGFGPGARSGQSEFEVTTGDAIAWGEVYFQGAGWVPFDVTPGGREAASEDDQASEQGGSGTAADPEDDTVADDRRHEPADPPGATGDTGSTGTIAATAGVGGALAVVLLVPVLRAARARRRLSLRASPRDRTMGAWRELRDGLRLAGAPVSRTRTVAEVVAAAERLLPESADGPRLGGLHRAVNQAGYGPAGAIEAHPAAKAADETRAYLRALRASLPRPRRLLWWLDPRPLFWRAS